jgi:hypothetical protein
MNRVTFPLGPRTERPEVADLHEALLFLGFAVSAAERTNRRFGGSTRAAVARVQTEHDLPVTGEVDAATAAAINALVEAPGLPGSGLPGSELPGSDLPGSELPGSELPGSELPGSELPGPELPGGPQPVPAGRRVEGTVRHADGTAISGLLVHAFHRRVGGEVSLGGEVLTDDRGRTPSATRRRTASPRSTSSSAPSTTGRSRSRCRRWSSTPAGRRCWT